MHPSTTFNINYCHYEDVTLEWLLGLRCGDIILMPTSMKFVDMSCHLYSPNLLLATERAGPLPHRSPECWYTCQYVW